jgi:hypothetical protein
MFFDQETIKSLEGKYLKFQDGVSRELKLVGHRSETRQGKSGPYTVNLLTVIDLETNEEKEVSADMKLMSRLAAQNDKLKDGSVIMIKPILIGQNINGYDKFDYEISIDPSS